METKEILRGWQSILSGRAPLLSVEITKECPLTCPGCYAYGNDHLGGETVLRQVSDYRGAELVERFIALVDRHRPLHVSIVGGEPLVRMRELDEILPKLHERGIHIQVVTSAVRPIPRHWARYSPITLAVSVDGLQPEHDVRRRPATYDRILKNIEGHKITVHCTITRQMTERPGYLRDFADFWSARDEAEKIWMSLFTPQVGETSYEILPPAVRARVLDDLYSLREIYPKLALPRPLLDVFANPPSSPDECIFARTTQSFTADLKRTITPCQFGGNPDCSQCGCIASAGLGAVARHKLPGGVKVAWLFDASLKVGKVVAAIRARYGSTA
jgi:MoaA/NifB/PqqE/SkfB family radical SAM enzyme